MKLRAAITGILIAFLSWTSASAAVFVGAGMVGVSQPVDNAESVYTPQFDFGGILGWQRPLGRFRFEVEASYHRRKFSVGDYTVGLHYLELPVLFSFSISPAIALGAGAFGSYGIGDMSQTQISSETSSSITFDDASLFPWTAGLLASLRIYFAPSSEKSLFLEGRYHYGVLNHASVGSFQHRDIVLLVGIRLGKG